jgi:CheY-like chemotaxis protein
LEDIFEGFRQGREAKERRVKGIGLGLHISRSLMRAMGGELTASSNAERTEFLLSVVLPLSSPSVQKIRPSGPTNRGKVLAIEDEEYNRLILGHLLEQMGYEVDWAIDGASAIDAVKGGRYDAIFTDYVLPDIDGSGLVACLKPYLQSPPPMIVAVTAYSSLEVVSRGLAAGISTFVTKPVSREKLEEAIGKIKSASDVKASSKSFCDCSLLLSLPDGKTYLKGYAESLSMAWEEFQILEDGEAASAAHSLRSLVLVVRAHTTANLLSELEANLRDGNAVAPPDLKKRIDVQIEAVLSAAASAAEP